MVVFTDKQTGSADLTPQETLAATASSAAVILARARSLLCGRPSAEAARWFKEADAFAAGSPFGYASVTGPIPLSDWGRVLPSASRAELEAVAARARDFYLRLPGEEDFTRQKTRVIAAARPYLKELARHGRLLRFGSAVGDIDLAYVDPALKDDGYKRRFQAETIAFIKRQRLYRRFPLFDWESLIYFACPGLPEFKRRLEQSREICSNVKDSPLPALEQVYLQRTYRTVRDVLRPERPVEL